MSTEEKEWNSRALAHQLFDEVLDEVVAWAPYSYRKPIGDAYSTRSQELIEEAIRLVRDAHSKESR